MAKRTYTDQDRANVYVAMRVNNENIARSSRDTTVPEATIRDWRDTWARDGGPPQEVLELAAGTATDFVIDATRVRDKALAELERQIDARDVKAAQLIAAVGMAEDKIRLAKGLATSRSETVQTLPDAEKLRELMQGYVRDTLLATDERDQDINDGEGAEIIPIDRELRATS